MNHKSMFTLFSLVILAARQGLADEAAARARPIYADGNHTATTPRASADDIMPGADDDGDSSSLYDRRASVGDVTVEANCGTGTTAYLLTTAYSSTAGVYLIRVYFPLAAYKSIAGLVRIFIEPSSPTGFDYGFMLVNGISTSIVDCVAQGGNCQSLWQLVSNEAIVDMSRVANPSNGQSSTRGLLSRSGTSRGATRSAGLDTEGQSVTRSGNPCIEDCERAPGSAGCAQCCRTVRHETPWRCANDETGSEGEDSAGCCRGEWDAQCWDTPSEANFGHSCNMCGPTSAPTTFVPPSTGTQIISATMMYKPHLMYYVKSLTVDKLDDGTVITVDCTPEATDIS